MVAAAVRAPVAVSGRRRQVLDAIAQAADPIGISELADRLDIHPNTVRFHLDRLTAAGYIEAVAPHHQGPGRPAHRYRAVLTMNRAGPRNYQLLARVLIESMAAEPNSISRARAAGRRWGERVAAGQSITGDPVRALMEVLDDAGFAPERTASSIDLRHCPFLDMSAEGDRSVCAVHLGLMQGALRGWNAATGVQRLETFAEPDVCRAHFTKG